MEHVAFNGDPPPEWTMETFHTKFAPTYNLDDQNCEFLVNKQLINKLGGSTGLEPFAAIDGFSNVVVTNNIIFFYQHGVTQITDWFLCIHHTQTREGCPRS